MIARWMRVLTAVIVLSILAACTDPTVVAIQTANQQFADGRFKAALDRYQALQITNPEVPELAYNAGNAFHALEEYSRALSQYSDAESTSDPLLRTFVSYNRGNTFFRMGRLDEAREAYKDVLRRDPEDRPAKFNIEMIDRILDQQARQAAAQQPQEGNEGQREDEEGANEQPGSGDSDSSNGPEDGQPGGSDQQQPPSEGPEAGGQPGGSGQRLPVDGTAPPTVEEALAGFQDSLSMNEALILLDALRDAQRGVRGLIEGPPAPEFPLRRDRQPLY